MKKHVLTLAAVIAMALSPQSGHAQKWLESIGKGLDKVNNALEQVDNALSGKSTTKKSSTKKKKKNKKSDDDSSQQAQTETTASKQAQAPSRELVLPNAPLAASSISSYPSGLWVSDPDRVHDCNEMYITRYVEPQADVNNKMGCGMIELTDKNQNTVYKGYLQYNGRFFDKSTGFGTDCYCFKSTSTTGQESYFVMSKGLKTDTTKGGYLQATIEVIKGDLADYPVVHDTLYSFNTGNGTIDPTPDAVDDKDLLELLQNGLDIGSHIYGFGDVKQFIKAHSGLEPGKPYYAVSKSGNAVNIRSDASTKASKLGELRAGTSLYVLDEHDGWCLVRLNKEKYGYISLSVVNLTNTPLAETTVDLKAQNEFPIDKIVTWGKSWGIGKLSKQKLIDNMKSLGYTFHSFSRLESGMEHFHEFAFSKGCTISKDNTFGKITSDHASIVFIGDDMAIPADLFFLVTNPDDYQTILNHAKKHMQSVDDYSTHAIPHGWQVEMTYHDGYFIP